MPLFHFVPACPSPSPHPQVHSLVGLRLYSHLAPRFFMESSFSLGLPKARELSAVILTSFLSLFLPLTPSPYPSLAVFQ